MQVMAHSSQGGTIRASEAAEALEFIASTVEARDIWVMGIKMVFFTVASYECACWYFTRLQVMCMKRL
jgi:hypothetical protein